MHSTMIESGKKAQMNHQKAACLPNPSLDREHVNGAAAEQIITHDHETVAWGAAHPGDHFPLLVPHHTAHALLYRMVLEHYVVLGRKHPSSALHAQGLALRAALIDLHPKDGMPLDVEGEEGVFGGDANPVSAGQCEPALEEQQLRGVLLEGYQDGFGADGDQVDHWSAVGEDVGVLHPHHGDWAVAVGQSDEVLGNVFGVVLEFFEEDDFAGLCAFVAGEEAAVVAAQIVALVEPADGSGLELGYAHADGFFQAGGRCLVGMDEPALHDHEQEGRQLLQDEVLSADLDCVSGFGEGVEDEHLLGGFGDDVVLVVEEAGCFLVQLQLQRGLAGQFLLGCRRHLDPLLHPFAPLDKQYRTKSITNDLPTSTPQDYTPQKTNSISLEQGLLNAYKSTQDGFQMCLFGLPYQQQYYTKLAHYPISQSQLSSQLVPPLVQPSRTQEMLNIIRFGSFELNLDVCFELLLIEPVLEGLLDVAPVIDLPHALLVHPGLKPRPQLAQPLQRLDLGLALLELLEFDGEFGVPVDVVHEDEDECDHFGEDVVLEDVVAFLVAELVEVAPGFGGGLVEQFGVPIDHLFDMSGLVGDFASVGLLLLVQLNDHLLQRLLLDILELLLLEQFVDQSKFVLPLGQLALVLGLAELLQLEHDHVLEDAVERELADAGLAEVQVFEDGEDAFLDEVEPVDLEVDLVDLPPFPQLDLQHLLFELAPLAAFETLPVLLLHKLQQLLAAPPLLGVVHQTVVEDLQPEAGVLDSSLLLPPAEPILEVHELAPYVLLPVLEPLGHADGAEQLVPCGEHFVEGAAEGVDVDFGVVDPVLVDFGGLVVVGAAVVEGLGEVGIADLGDTEVDEVHTALVVLVLVDQVGRLEVAVDEGQSILLLLARFGPVAFEGLVVQVVQYLCAALDELEHVFLLHGFLDAVEEGALRCVLQHQVVPFGVLLLEDVVDLQQILVVPYVFEPLEDHQLLVEVLLVEPLLRLFVLFEDYLVVAESAVDLLFPDGHVDDAEASSSEKLIPPESVVPHIADDGILSAALVLRLQRVLLVLHANAYTL